MKGLMLLRRSRLAGSLLALGALLVGCTNVVKGVGLGVGESPALDRQLRFSLSGTGTCQSVNVDWGDGTTQPAVVPVPGRRIELDTSFVESRTLTHVFTGWGGGKTVTVDTNAASGCEGKANFRFNVAPAERRLGLAQPGTGPGTCATVANSPLPPMIPRMLVHLRATPLAPPWDKGIDFGCAGCVFDANGLPGSVAVAPFPFPGLRTFSLVLRIGPQIVQGGTNVQFVTTASGPLEFCLNDLDNDTTNNRGGYELVISVDQLGP